MCAERGLQVIHKIKILESFANAVDIGDKTFEIRKNDRGYQRGDLVEFVVLYDSDNLKFTSHPLYGKRYEITYVLSGWGLEDGYCVFGIKPVENDEPKKDDEIIFKCDKCGVVFGERPNICYSSFGPYGPHYCMPCPECKNTCWSDGGKEK